MSHNPSAMSMIGKRVLVTGANSGIGLWTARSLAEQGAEVVLVCRDADRGAAVHSELTGMALAPPSLLLADLSSQDAVRRLAAEVQTAFDHIDVLVNNAGSVFSKRELTVDGIEKTFAVNHLAPFLLTNLLLEMVAAAPQGRIVTVASEAHAARIDFANLQGERKYQFFKAYAASKTTNILFTYELARRVPGSRLTVNAVSPGPSRTHFGNNLTGAAAAFPKIMKRMPFFHSGQEGSRVVVFAASDPDLTGITGQFFMKSKPRKSKPVTHDQSVAARLWSVSEELTSSTLSAR
jgi:retinol dehydrogenase-14